jgi:hypothetical protein
MQRNAERPRPTIWMAVLVPLLVALCLATWVHTSWVGPCIHPVHRIPGPLGLPAYLLGIPAALTAWYSWYRGQSFWIIGVQMALSVTLTLVFTAFMFAATTDVGACFS